MDPLSNPIVSVVKTRLIVEDDDMDDEDEEGTTDATANASSEGENKEAPIEAAEEKA